MSLYAGDHDSRNIIAERDMYKAQCATQAAQIEALQSALEFARDKLPALILAVRDAPLGDSLGRANEALANGFQVINSALSNTGKK